MAGCSVAILFLCLQEVSLVWMLFSSLFNMELDFFLGGSSTIVTIGRGCGIQGGMGTMEAEVLEGVGG